MKKAILIFMVLLFECSAFGQIVRCNRKAQVDAL